MRVTWESLKFLKKNGGPVLRVLQATSLFLLVILFRTGFDIDIKPFAAFFILFANAYMVYASRHNIMMLLITPIILYCNYSILYVNVIHILKSSYYTTILSPSVSNISLNALLGLTCILLLFVRWDKIKKVKSVSFPVRKKVNPIVFFFLVLILVAVFFKGFTRPTALGERGEPHPVYEYSLAFFILLFYLFGNWKTGRVIGVIIVCFYSLQNFIFGGRIMGIQFLLCAYLMYYVKVIPKKIVAIALVFFVLFMSVIGTMRAELLLGGFSVRGIVQALAENGFALDTAYAAYFTSETYVFCHDLIPQSERLFLFGQFIRGIFLSMNPEYVVPEITNAYVTHYGGGMPPHFFYFYIGPLGVLISGILIAVYLNIVRKVTTRTPGLIKCIGVFVVCHTFRWYLYSPLGLLRGILFLVIVYYGFVFLRQLLRIKKKRRVVYGVSY